MDHRNDFTTWLLQQTNRDDSVGDLAKDFSADDRAESALDLEQITHGAAYRAFEQAIGEYEKLQIFA